ncbi:TetR/AcrR family transcriptional regulator [Leptospira bourretii]|uniref:TetR/AcrR family transcriptional regulator n=1 Tax=Leptospira bourretii TaxID=2484962 RepID=A0A4R9IGW0_9LEPT|nr:TetR/AcrR family transcriptional regulator [Leptospira bourretii]TGK87233.1 TetR/AcrR family transcriptional regulator [Leptospira bourretii]TGK87610.1 TetR/AcrR family transcriptional regulator [Leptospira bourretii]TGL38056.1 TetR/AcrR family transcriptional regulator [Leptospira bourretii]
MKQKIIQTALKICEKDGYESFSMRKLATKLGVDPMAVYHYFENKDALTLAMVEQIFNRFQGRVAVVDKPSKSTLKIILYEYWNLFLDYPGMSLYLIKNSYNGFPSVVTFNQTLEYLIEKVFPKADIEKTLNIIIDFIHGNALAFSFVSYKKQKVKLSPANQKEFESLLVYLLDSL